MQLKIARDAGASLVEFTLVLPVLLLLAAGLIDAGIVLHKYGRLTDTTSAITREISASVGEAAEQQGGLNCSQLAAKSSSAIQDYVAAHPVLTTGFDFVVASVNAGADIQAPFPTVEIVGSWPIRCIYCNFFPAGTALSTSSRLVLEVSLTDTTCN